MNIVVIVLICVGVVLLFWLILPKRRDNPMRGLDMGNQRGLVGSSQLGGLQSMDRGELLGLLNRKQKIAAIKRYREMTGADLKEAKTAVELMEQELLGMPLPLTEIASVDVSLVNVDGQLEDGQSTLFMVEIQQLLAQGNKIAAIKRYREGTGASLRDAKDIIDRLDAKMRSGL